MGRQAGCVRAYIGPNRESSGSRPEDPAVLLGPDGLVASHDSLVHYPSQAAKDVCNFLVTNGTQDIRSSTHGEIAWLASMFLVAAWDSSRVAVERCNY